jgi:L-alanine-DL-glutamate epimerase-like enolase superfamily enzyme
VIQADPDWCGGITELVKICTLAWCYGRPVFPHGHSIHAALHVIAAQSPGVCPMAEFLIRPQRAKQALYARPLWPTNGVSDLPAEPGLGIRLAKERIDSRRRLTRDTDSRCRPPRRRVIAYHRSSATHPAAQTRPASTAPAR